MTRFEELFGAIEADPGFRSLLDRFQAAEVRTCVLEGLTDGLKAPLLVAMAALLKRPMVIVRADEKSLEDFAASIDFYFRQRTERKATHAVALPGYDCGPYDHLSPHSEIAEQRALALAKIRSGAAHFTVTSPAVLLSRWPDPDFFIPLAKGLYKDQSLAVDELRAWLVSSGYYPSEPVSGVGEFSIRGGILDVFSPSEPQPVRVEFFGDNIESIRQFNVETQRSLRALDSLTLFAVRDIPVTPELMKRWAEAATLKLAPEARSVWEEKIQAAYQGESFAGVEFQLPLLQPYRHTLLAYFQNPLLVFDEPGEIEDHWKTLWHKSESEFREKSPVFDALVRPEELFLAPGEAESTFGTTDQLRLSTLALPSSTGETETISIASQPVRRFHGRFSQFIAEAASLESRNYQLSAVVRTSAKAEILKDVLREYLHRTPASRTPSFPEKGEGGLPAASSLSLTAPIPVFIGAVDTGFLLPDRQLALFGDLDIFEPMEYRAGLRTSRPKRTAFISDFSDLKIGDLMVHVDHGIGRFMGIKSLELQDATEEFMELQYQDDAKLYLPLERLDLVQKYSGAGGAPPLLDKLGGVTWQRTKSKAKRRIRDLAEDLLKLYAERRIQPGIPYSADSEWMREFEASFEFTETPDQAQTIEDVKHDMERGSPMDRLVCGDVGYGKTEVAMRAALKAVVDHKQVAVLTPTTVLAYQHFVTFRTRFEPFPVSVEMLSRFRDKREQKKILEQVAAGKIDILIGTHRLLSKDVEFLDLGLMIVDEEQRFGVAHKERLKQITKSIDCLTLTATPIPRTLQMSLMGVRDMSVIETPPKDRLTINTVVTRFDPRLIQTALEHELERGGQAYFVHNRVESIYSVAALVTRQCPRARVAVAHGQMGERDLEQVMLKFMRHEYDVLVATTLIENGLDIPLVNTLIVNRADKFGLAQLYQLRGRVGRSNRRAYAYLLVPPDQGLSPIARRRLNALKEFSDLGSGFRIAALDLELRGAGTLLGHRQHGYINSIGFETYCQLLENTIQELKGEEVPPETHTTINLHLDIKIPPTYIADENLRLVTYKRVSNIHSDAEAVRLREELIDRFGALAEPVQNLLSYAQLKFLAESMQVKSIDRDRATVLVQFHDHTQTAPEALVALLDRDPRVQISPTGRIKIQMEKTVPSYILARTREVLHELASPVGVQ
jgi:transcription-repair coupling factor (superfamily II helicase)